jgi:t-SNARE complex subunit (syntaxin)
MDILDDKIKVLFRELNHNIRVNNNPKKKKKKVKIILNIKTISELLKDYQINSNKLMDIETMIDNNTTSLDIMNNEVSSKTNAINDIHNNFLVDNYELTELNKNEKNIDILNDLYSKRIKYLIIMFLILVFIYYVVVNTNPH